VAKAHARRKRKAIRIPREPRFEFGIAGILQGGYICRQEIHLLHQSALNDFIILIEPEGNGFTEENLLAHPLLDQRTHFLSRRRRPPLREPVHRQLAKVILRQCDLIGSADPVGDWVRQFVDCEDKRTGDKEMEEWFSQPPARKGGWFRANLRPVRFGLHRVRCRLGYHEFTCWVGASI